MPETDTSYIPQLMTAIVGASGALAGLTGVIIAQIHSSRLPASAKKWPIRLLVFTFLFSGLAIVYAISWLNSPHNLSKVIALLSFGVQIVWFLMVACSFWLIQTQGARTEQHSTQRNCYRPEELGKEDGAVNTTSIERLTLVLIIATILGILLIVIANTSIANETGKRVVEAIGIGLLVAGLVGATVERYAKAQMKRETDRMLREIRTDVFRATLGTHFPEPLWIQVWNHIVLRTVVRKKVILDYNLEIISKQTDFVKVRACWSYTLCNLNPTAKQDYQLVAAIDMPFHKDLAAETKFTNLTVNEEPVLPKCEVSKTNAEVICKVGIQLDPSEEKRIEIRGETALRSDQVVAHSMVDPTIDLEVSVTKPPELAVVLDPLHAREDRLTEISTASESNRKCWRISGGILPGQGVNLRWYPVTNVSELGMSGERQETKPHVANQV